MINTITPEYVKNFANVVLIAENRRKLVAIQMAKRRRFAIEANTKYHKCSKGALSAARGH